ncbi:MAG: SPFH/Band 7/PHB domain protein [Armatimonadetes bacterium]|nr:SPFH/Band 7/PHB domain protein [Armatimonadota bacterium]
MTWIAVLAAALAAVIIARAVYVVRQYERGVVETFGRFTRVAEPGLAIIMPFVQRLIRVDMREAVLDVAPQEVITKDNAMVTVDAVVYYEVTDPVKRTYNVTDFRRAAIKLAQTNLRNIIGDMELDEALTSRERINSHLRAVLDDATDKWGVRITRVELQAIEPPKDIVEAMSRQMKAERDKRATILEAEGIRQAAILKAEGEKQARVLQAEGEAEAIRRVADATKYREITVAEGQAQAIRTVFGGIHDGRPTNDLLAYKYLETLQKIADGRATKIFLPLEASSILAGIAAAGVAFKEGAESGRGSGEAHGQNAAGGESPTPTSTGPA